MDPRGNANIHLPPANQISAVIGSLQKEAEGKMYSEGPQGMNSLTSKCAKPQNPGYQSCQGDTIKKQG